jgi:small-conductance mechanosensitive channel
LSEKVLPKTRIDDSLQQSIIQVAGYIGLIVALLVGISSLGFDLTSLALIAGALSVGIGFGLQSIVSNFVSGLILLFERPIKIGDWIITNSGEGIVKKINVRATEVETFDRTSIIIPNSELISASVKNWTHKDKIGRIIIKVGVSYDSDPHQVLELLKEYVTDNDLLLQWPKPKIVFMDFADSALIFDLRFFIHDIQEVNEIQTQVRLDIWDLFKAHDIEISYPQRDIHIRSAAGLKELAHDQ